MTIVMTTNEMKSYGLGKEFLKLGGRQSQSKSILCTGDNHVGSWMAVSTLNPILSNGEEIKPSKVMKVLNAVWYDVADSLHMPKPNLMVCNGEPIDGSNPKQQGQQSWTSDYEDQMQDYMKLMKAFHYRQLLFTRGSGYHTTTGATNYEEVLANRMNAIKYKAHGGGGATDYYANVEVNGKIFNFSHHIGFSKGLQTRAAALSREMANMHYEKDKIGNVDAIIRNHVHYFWHNEGVHTHGIIVPAWKYPDGHLFRGGVAGTTPDIGMVEIIVEPNGHIDVRKHIAELGSSLKARVCHI